MDNRMRLQSKHLSDLGILTTIAAISSAKKVADRSINVPRVKLQDLEEVMPNIPRKLLQAKMRKMTRRNLIATVGHASTSRYVINIEGYQYLENTLRRYQLRAKYAAEARRRV